VPAWGDRFFLPVASESCLSIAGKFNMATLEPSCTMDLFMGNSSLWSTTTNETLHFDGLNVLQASIAKLGELGFSLFFCDFQ
jgi:hypothetical protein